MGKSLKGKELGKGITQKKDRRYSARFTDRFGKRVEYNSVDLIEVKKWLKEKSAEDELKQNVRDESTTLDQWYDIWFTTYKSGNGISPNTRRHYKHVYESHIKPSFGKKKLTDVKQVDIVGLLKELEKQGYRYETKSKVKILLTDIYNKAIINELVARNPTRGINLEKDSIEPRALTLEEQRKFFECSKGTFYDNLFMVHILTGMRPGEVCALTEKDIDFENLYIDVNKTLVYQKLEELGDTKKEFHIGPPKTKSSYRKIKIDERCAEVLKKQLKQKEVITGRQNAKDCKGFEHLIFTTKYNTPINSQIYCDAIKRIVDELNLQLDELEQIETFNPHTFRHTFATRCFEAGVSPKTVQDMLGHATLKMTMDLYTHLLEEHKVEEYKKLSGYMDSLFVDVDTSTIDEEYVDDL